MTNQLLAPVKDIQLTATIPMEMVNAQQQIITWCDLKLASLRFESAELLAATEHAKKSKWKFTTLQSQYGKSVRKISYYEKMKSALLEGYYIVPNFPIQMFAVKTKRDRPLPMQTWSYWSNKDQSPQELPETVGEYKNPAPLVERVSKKDADGKDISESWATDWQDIEFPITMAKPQIMEATSRAMALKIFDQIGIMPATRNDDPVIIGQIIMKSGYTQKTVSFMIAWYLDTKVL